MNDLCTITMSKAAGKNFDEDATKMAKSVESLLDSPPSSVGSGASGSGRRRLVRQFCFHEDEESFHKKLVKINLMSTVLISIWVVNGVAVSLMLLNT